MAGLKLAEIIRYLATGILIFLIFYLCSPTTVSKIMADFGSVTGPLIVFVSGTIFFLVYRTLLYNLILFQILDRINSSNVRGQLKEKYNIRGKYEAEIIWKSISRVVMEQDNSILALPSSEVHLLYVTSILTVVGAIILGVTEFQSIYDSWQVLVALVSISFLTGAGALFYDYRIEKIEGFVLQASNLDSITEYMSKIGYEAGVKIPNTYMTGSVKEQ